VSAKFTFIDAEKAQYSIVKMCTWMGVSTSGFYEWRDRHPPRRPAGAGRLATLIEWIFNDSDHTYGHRRIHAALHRQGERVTPELVRSIMRERGLTPCQPRPFRPTTTVAGDSSATPDLLARAWRASAIFPLLRALRNRRPNPDQPAVIAAPPKCRSSSGRSLGGGLVEIFCSTAGPFGRALLGKGRRSFASSFEPKIVAKRQRRLSGVDELVLSLSAKGLTTGEVQAHLAEVYGAQVSRQPISTITDKVVEGMAEWQNRPLDPPTASTGARQPATTVAPA